MDDQDANFSLSSLQSWNTRISRMRVTSVSSMRMHGHSESPLRGLEDVLTAVQSLKLQRYPYNTLESEETIGEGATFVVEKCFSGDNVFAVKHLKLKGYKPHQPEFQSRLHSVLLELRIMEHSPLRHHPNILGLLGYGWNMQQSQLRPYILVEYSVFGNCRRYLKTSSSLTLLAKEILLGDIAAGLRAIHICDIVHGDVKLDNVLVFQSWDRPSGVIAKIADFGYSLLVNQHNDADAVVTYGGTDIYNAPEIQGQTGSSAEPRELHKLDVWAFGLLAWEIFLDGDYYTHHLCSDLETLNTDPSEVIKTPRLLLDVVKRSVNKSVKAPMNSLRRAMIQGVFKMTLVADPTTRVSDLTKLPIMAKWHSTGFTNSLTTLALHLQSSELSFDVFRPDHEHEVVWPHQREIYLGLERYYTVAKAKDPTRIAEVAWQIAICYYLGFGVSRDYGLADERIREAKELNHPVALLFSQPRATQSRIQAAEYCAAYRSFVSGLFRQSMNIRKAEVDEAPLVEAGRRGDFVAVLKLLRSGAEPTQTGSDGSTILHWLFMFSEVEKKDLESYLTAERQLLSVDRHCHQVYNIHRQWPLKLTGSPLSMAILAADVSAVKLLLRLGANPFAKAFDSTQFGEQDYKSHWTAMHVAAQYHHSEILQIFLSVREAFPFNSAFSCALSFSSPLERIAIHGVEEGRRLESTIRLLDDHGDVESASVSGMTPLMQAIDFDDDSVVSAILLQRPSLAAKPFTDPDNPKRWNFPIHFSAQIAALRDTPESKEIMNLIHCKDELSFSRLDSSGSTPLHLAVTGPSSGAAEWLLDKAPYLLNTKDYGGRTPLFFCESSPSCELLCSHGAEVDAVDMFQLSALHHMVSRGCIDAAEALIDGGTNLNIQGNDFETPLHYAVHSRNREAVFLLLDAGASVNITNLEGETPLHIAARKAQGTVVRSLVAHGANDTIRNNAGQTPLGISIIYGNTSASMELIQCKHIDLTNQRLDSFGNTALHLCAQYGNNFVMESLHKLVRYSPFLELLVNKDGQNPLHLAARYGQAGSCLLLLQHATSNECLPRLRKASDTVVWNTAVHWAVHESEIPIKNQVETLKTLMKFDFKAILDWKNAAGDLPWDIATRNFLSNPERLGAVSYLLDKGELSTCRHLQIRSGRHIGRIILEAGKLSGDEHLFQGLARHDTAFHQEIFDFVIRSGNAPVLQHLICCNTMSEAAKQLPFELVRKSTDWSLEQSDLDSPHVDAFYKNGKAIYTYGMWEKETEKELKELAKRSDESKKLRWTLRLR